MAENHVGAAAQTTDMEIDELTFRRWARRLPTPARRRTVEIILLLTGLLPLMVGYGVVISEAMASSMPSQSFLPAKLCLVCFLATVMAFSCWGGVLACAWIARRICGVSEAATQRMKD